LCLARFLTEFRCKPLIIMPVAKHAPTFARSSHTWRSLAGWTLLALAGMLAALVVVLSLMDWNRMRGPVGAYLSHRLGREVRIQGDLSVDLFRLQPRIHARSVEVRNPGWMARYARPAGRFADIKVELRLLPLFLGRLVVPSVELDKPDVLVVRERSGRSNWDSADGGDAGPWKFPPIHRFEIHDGNIEIHDGVRGLDFAGTVNSHEQGGRQGAFMLNGKGTLNNKLFAADVRGGPLLNVDETRPYAFSADLHAGKTHAAIKGEIDHPFQFDHYRAALRLSGDNLADIYYLTGLALPGTPPYQLNVTIRRDGMVYKLTDLAGMVGKSDLAGNLSINVSKKVPVLAGRMASRSLNFTDLGALFGGGGGAKARGAHLLPDTPLHTERLRQTDAEVDFSAAKVASRDFPLTSLDTHVSLENGVLKLDPLVIRNGSGPAQRHAAGGRATGCAHHRDGCAYYECHGGKLHQRSREGDPGCAGGTRPLDRPWRFRAPGRGNGKRRFHRRDSTGPDSQVAGRMAGCQCGLCPGTDTGRRQQQHGRALCRIAFCCKERRHGRAAIRFRY
jgi:uncharacterized protein involved in outer membrane biogenesis